MAQKKSSSQYLAEKLAAMSREERQAFRQRRMDANRERKYGVSMGELHELLELQYGRCGACAKPLTLSLVDGLAKTDKAAVDHDHRTGAVRGILCCACNSALGLVRESPRILGALIDYLEETACRSASSS